MAVYSFCIRLHLTASTSTSHVLASTSSSSQQASSFHSSAVAHEKKKKMVARLKKKANLARRHEAQEQLRATAPDTIRGYGPNNQNLWYESELRKILLYPEEVYEGKAGLKGMLASLPNPEDEVLGPKGIKSDDIVAPTSSDSDSSSSQTTAASSSSTPPIYFNFAMTPEDGDFLFKALPEANITLKTATSQSNHQADIMPQVQSTEQHKAEATRRILDLANANARGIRFENTRRIIRRFGQGEGSGRCEVQGRHYASEIMAFLRLRRFLTLTFQPPSLRCAYTAWQTTCKKCLATFTPNAISRGLS